MFRWSHSWTGPAASALSLAATLLFLGCTRQDAGADAHALRISQRNEPADLDPATATLPDEFFIIRALGEGLVVPAMDGGAPQPAVADRWEISADGMNYTFHLRENLRWSNGEPLAAEDFIASFQRAL